MSDIAPLDYQESEEFTPTADEKNVALLAHVLTLLVGFIAPLIIYLVKKDESEYVRAHAVESLNFQISIFIYAIACIPLVFILIGIPLLILIGFGTLILAIIATIRASEGKMYRYPLTMRLIK